MFKKTKNIDSAFRHIRGFTMLVITGGIIICCYTLYKSYSLVSEMQTKIYVLANGKALEAYASSRTEDIPVEARDHIRMFHHYFFTLDPDDKVIRANITKALYLADGSAERAYDDLKESGYYAGIISGNISQRIHMDSIFISTNAYPYHFKYYATERIIRTTSIVYRSLITEGDLRNVSRSDNDPHGFLIEHWHILENKDIKVETR